MYFGQDSLILSENFAENSIITIDSVRSLPIPVPPESGVNYYGISAIAAASGAGVYFIRDYFKNTWWKDQRTSEFKITWDNDYALGVDKFGHFFGTYLFSHGFSAAFDASDVEREKAVWYSASLALAFQLYVEIEDGFGPLWGFSPGDAICDLLGSAYWVAQYYYPFLNNFQPRVSYYPSEKFLNGDKNHSNISDDYEGQKLWLGLRMKNLLPKEIAEYWPSFLMLSVGVGAQGLDGIGGGERQFYIAFDLDPLEIPLYGSFWQFIKNTLDMIHFPMPGIRISPKTAAFLICF